jgi:3-oxoacyl-[acyl-carrier-protein] synthase III
MPRSRITGLGMYVPERVVTNADLEQLMDTTDAWIVERTGIRERRFAAPGQGTTELAAEASRRALADAGRTVADVDFIVFATITRDLAFPGCGTLLQDRLGMPGVGAMDVHNACSGFLYALDMADALVRAGQYRCVLAVGAEVLSTGLDLTTRGRDMAVLFGDGAGAVVVEPSDDDARGVLGWVLHSDGSHAEDLVCEAPSSLLQGRITPEMVVEGRHYPKMNGRQVFKHATTRFPEVIQEVLEQTGHHLADVRLIVPHQANQRIGDAVAQRLGVAPGVVFQDIDHFGNTTAASIPIALTEAREQGRFGSGDLLVLAAFGSGFGWGATALRW